MCSRAGLRATVRSVTLPRMRTNLMRHSLLLLKLVS